MRIPTEHFRNVPVVLLSPSLMTTPVTSTAPSPSHHAHLPANGSANVFDDAFPRSLLERLMRTETQSKVTFFLPINKTDNRPSTTAMLDSLESQFQTFEIPGFVVQFS